MQELQKNKINIGLIGIGSMGKNHLRVLSLLKDFNLKILCDKNTELLNKYSLQYNVETTTNISDLGDICDAVIVATPTSYHLESVKLLSNKVQNFFIEKPMVSSSQEAEDLKKLMLDNNLNIQVGFIERYNPTVLALSNIINSSNKKGHDEVINIDFIRANKVDRIQDVDVVLDLMIHDIDLALYLNGTVTDIHSNGKCHNNSAEFCIATLRHLNGATSRLLASKLTNKKIRSIHVTTYGSFIDCDLLKKEIFINKTSDLISSTNDFYKVESTSEIIEVSYQEALLSELISFSKLCLGQEDNQPGFQDGLNALKIAEEIQLNLYK